MRSSVSSSSESMLPLRRFSRRSFGKLATALTAGAAFPVWNEQALAQMSRLQTIPPGAIRINANENPLGPSADAADAIHGIVRNGGRYMYDLTDALAREMAEGLGVKYSSNPDESYIRIFAGSSAPLHQAVFAFASKDRPFVKADPGYEAGEWAAKFSGASVVNVPLKDKTWEHDVKAMLQVAPNGGLYYVCNPNNPTGTVTSRADIEYLVANKPSSAVVMIDEAYIHFSKSATPCCDLAAAGKDVLILRTFSKIYGMAGLRAGAAIARPDLLQKVAQFSMGAMPVTAMAGALASLRAPNLVAERRKYMSDIRDATCDWLAKQNVEFIPSETNCFMINVKRPGPEFYRAMAAQNIYIGRAWPVWPNWVRVSVGTAEEMAKFRDAFAKAYNA